MASEEGSVEVCKFGTTQFKEGGGLACTTICLYWAHFLLNHDGKKGVLKSDLIAVMKEGCDYWARHIRTAQMMSKAIAMHDHLELVQVREASSVEKKGKNIECHIRQWVCEVNKRKMLQARYDFCDEVLVLVVGNRNNNTMSEVAFTYLLAIYGYTLAFFDSHKGIRVTFDCIPNAVEFLSKAYNLMSEEKLIDYYWLRKKDAPKPHFPVHISSSFFKSVY
jgi:hypothetical protein